MSELNEEIQCPLRSLTSGTAIRQCLAFSPFFRLPSLHFLPRGSISYPPSTQVSVATAIQAVLTRELEEVRQERFGSAPIGFQVVDTRLGSLTFALLITILVGLRQYKPLRESTLLLVGDIKSVASRIRRSAIAE